MKTLVRDLNNPALLKIEFVVGDRPANFITSDIPSDIDSEDADCLDVIANGDGTFKAVTNAARLATKNADRAARQAALATAKADRATRLAALKTLSQKPEGTPYTALEIQQILRALVREVFGE